MRRWGGVVGGAEAGLLGVRDKVHVHDLHATILQLMGIDHEPLTDVSGKVVRSILA